MVKKVLLLTLLLWPGIALAKINIVTTTTDLAALAQAVGGAHVEVKSLCRGDQDPHYLEPKPSYARLMNRADLMIEVGLDLEVGWLPVLLTQSRNPKIQPGTKGNLNASQGIRILEIPRGRIDRSMGDVHPDGNPHYWLDPRNGMKVAAHIAHRLGELDPEHAAQYQHNLSRFNALMLQKLNQWASRARRLRGKRVITDHRTFSYFAAWLGLDVVDVIEPKPGIPPSPAHILSLIERMKREPVMTLMVTNFSNPKPAEELSRRGSVQLTVVPSSVKGVKTVATYPELFEYLLQKLKALL